MRYDDYYRPIICNPYHQNVQIVYIYDNRPRIVVVPPLGSIVLGALAYGAYSFTALVVDTVEAVVQTAVNVAVGSFFGGGYYPGQYGYPGQYDGYPGQYGGYQGQYPAPPPLQTYDQVPVVVNYRDARYQPFVVQRIVDAGDDAQYGERRVLLDGVTPVWGQWTQTQDGQRQFEVHRTQQFPGLEDPAEGPLPGDYQLTLADSSSSGVTPKALYVIVASAVVSTLAACWAVAWGIGRRRARLRH